MADKKENEFDEGFNEEFNFGEETIEAEPIAVKTPSRGFSFVQNKRLPIIIGAIVLTSISYFGYRFYSKSNVESPEKQTYAANTITPNTSTIQAPNLPPKPEPMTADELTTKPQFEPPKPPAPETTANNGNKESNTIEQFQKELFAPEKSETANGKPTDTYPKAETKTPAETAAKDVPKTMAAQNQTPPPPLPPPAVSEEKVNQLIQAMDRLSSQMDYNLSQIKYLESYTRELSESLAKLNDAIKTTDSRISKLTNTTTSLSKDVGSVRKEMGQVQQILGEDALELPEGPIGTRPKVSASIAVEEPEFIVHAVIPGRAWLRSSRGQIITVTEGDALGNYGKVVVIDAANGVVLTSSGVSFR